MQLNFDRFSELSFIVGSALVVEEMQSVRPLQPFDDRVIAFLNDLSKELMSCSRDYSDVATFGFWCRRSALLNEKSKYDDINERIGRGITFHSTPSNVPVNFAFSFAAGLLAGNANIVRLPAKNFEQVGIICRAINKLLAGAHAEIVPYISMVKYPSVKEISDTFSAICDSRVVWGGDNTINELRQSPLKPRSVEINFADRHSIAVINADKYLEAADKDAIAQSFYNDTYFSDQNACTAPRIIVWLGKEISKAKVIFWDKIHTKAKKEYTLAPVQSVGKLSAFCRVASQKNVKLAKSEDEYITRVALNSLDEDIMNYKYNSGFFFEYDAIDLKEILPLATERCQTLTYYGLSVEDLRRLITTLGPRGIDRAVPMGKSMDFTLVWDGYDLIRCLSRKVTVL